MISNWTPTACILCSRNCALLVKTEQGHITKIRGDESNPISEGYLCQKATRLDYYQNHADRLKQPLRRKTDGGFEPISWDTAISEIANKLLGLRTAHGNVCLAYYGGGGQGNHMGGLYANAFRSAVGIPYFYSPLAQEKTGDFWVDGKLFGRQYCHTTEDVEYADCVMFIGTNPWQAHGIRNARVTLRQIAKDPDRCMIVVDPRRTETAKMADIHLQLKPSTDAYLLSAMLAIIVTEQWEDRAFLQKRTLGFTELRDVLLEIPIKDYIQIAGVNSKLVYEATRLFANAENAAVRADLGLQQSLNSTLNSYLEKLLFIVTGNFGKKGGNNFHSFLIPFIGDSRPKGSKKTLTKTIISNITEIAGLFPPNVLPAEIDTDHPDRIRALLVDSANPAVSGANTDAYDRALQKLELLVVIDVAMTETAKHAHYILPAASQFEKWEATFFNLDFPVNGFHLRRPLFAKPDECLPEPEIYQRLAQAMNLIPKRWPLLSLAARLHHLWPQSGIYRYALGLALTIKPKFKSIVPFVLQGSYGRLLSKTSPAIATLWGATQLYVQKHGEAVTRTGLTGRGPNLAEALFKRIIKGHNGVLLSEHHFKDTWSFIKNKDARIHLIVVEMFHALQALQKTPHKMDKDYPLILIAGERRAYNANTIYRDPKWRKTDIDGAIRVHPQDAKRLGLSHDAYAICESKWGKLKVLVNVCDSIQPGVVGLPHGYGLEYPGNDGIRVEHGPFINRLTGSEHCDPITATPYHKFVPVRLKPSH